MLLRHPDECTDEQLETWIRHLVDDQVEEGPRLDYKQELGLSSRPARREAAKDISSFANEIGGVVLYGIPERSGENETPVPVRPYGMDPVAGLEGQLEDIYAETIWPNLGQYRIRCVPLSEYAGKVAYLVWTPEPWLGPHMVQGYSEGRYYRRGQFRAVVMGEHEVRERYHRFQRTRERLEEFLTSSDIAFPAGVFFSADAHIPGASHYVITPHVTYDLVDLASSSMRSWLDINRYVPLGEEWCPASWGARRGDLAARPSPLYPNRAFFDDFVQLFTNGAVSRWGMAEERDTGTELFQLHPQGELRRLAEFLRFVHRFFKQIGYWGPLRFQGTIKTQKKNMILQLGDIPIDWGSLVRPDGTASFAFDCASSQLAGDPLAVLRKAGDEMFKAFGLWNADACFGRPTWLRDLQDVFPLT